MSTESIDPDLQEIDRWPLERAVAAILAGQGRAVAAVVRVDEAIAHAATAAAARLGASGRIAYAGAGTSGRIGVQDGVELTPTFGWPEDRLAFFLAGGPDAMMRAVEGAEDDEGAGRTAVREAGLGGVDVLIGLAASGRTPFTIGAVREARERGALTIAVANNPGSALLQAGEHAILLDTGAEAVAGSTRLGAGTAQKAALNALSTAIMLKLGLVYRGLMVNMRISNAKLEGRAIAMIERVAGVDADRAKDALATAEGDIRVAVLIALGHDREAARRSLETGEPFDATVDRLRG
ncbi:N-acetylmuramic acid 6-phosphate etherase [Erythrobacter sp. LQ02-29]|uniref:N-acetylmuramic acid 6-phosphate etherase n=1 Tax=Erythrobacter sp. LQ02-29 TaxID=2920384 RepID=UPI001F4EB93E|nr:N-acetylmuramic acid 6-phosphate etherase [Erythrobacter sp. LQ02-29]MCP9223696.1 N-acetylmuramic acid 6-phosphate etherase [Erythrobacter sp. LQ02-29]